MTKSIKLKNDIKIDSKSINYKRINLETILDGDEYNVDNYLVNNWETNGQSFMFKIGNIKVLQFSVRNGTSQTVVSALPSVMRPRGTVLVMASNLANVGYAIIYTTGEIIIYGNIFSSGASNLVFSAVYL